jgi:hypothetical protein
MPEIAVPCTNGANGMAPAAASPVQEQIDAVLSQHQTLRGELADLLERIERQQQVVAAAELAISERDSLRQQVRELQRRFRQAQEASASTPTIDADVYNELQEQFAQTQLARDEALAAQERIAGENQALRLENEDQQLQIATLKAEIEGWVAELEASQASLSQEQALRQEAEQRIEVALADQQRLREEAGGLTADLQTEQRLRRLLEERLRVLETAGAGPGDASPTSPAPQFGSMIDALRDLVDAVRRPEDDGSLQAELHSVQVGLTELRGRQEALERIVAAGLGTPGSSLPVAAPASPPEPVELLSPEPQAEPIKAVKAELGDEPAVAATGQLVDGSAEQRAVEAEVSSDPPWQDEFDRIERAWLAGRAVGARHDQLPFLHIVGKMRRAHAKWRDDDVLLNQLDVIRARFGEHFTYCRLAHAVDRLHRPSLDPALVLKTMGPARPHIHG